MLTEDKLTAFSRDARLTLVVASKVSSQSVLQDVDRRLANNTEASVAVPCILWNLRPYNNFNLVHAVYLERLRYYQELGFSVVIVLYDNFLAKMSGTSRTFAEIKIGVANLRAWVKACGLKLHKTEVLLESDLWRLYAPDILERVTSLIHSPANASILGTSGVSDMLDSVFELVYESLLQVDFVLTGEDPNNVWNRFRLDSLRELKSKVPSLLSVPLIMNPLSMRPTSSRDDEFNVFLSSDRIRAIIRSAQEEFVKQMFDYLLIPKEHPRAIRIGRISFWSYEDAKAHGILDDKLRGYASDRVVDQFRRLQKAKL